MKYGAFMADLRSRGARHVCLLAGEETYYIDRAEKAVLGLLFPDGDAADQVQRIDRATKPDEIADILGATSFFSERNVTVVHAAELFREKKASGGDAEQQKGKSRADKAMDRLVSVVSDMPETNYVIFKTYSKADKRKKLYKAIEKNGAVLEAEPERPWTVDEWLRGKLAELGRSFDREAMSYFMEVVAMMQTVSLSFLDGELEKLALYTDAKMIGRGDLIRAFSHLPEVSSFAMLDAVNVRDVRKALTVLERQIDDGAYLPLLLAGIARHVRQLWQARRLMAGGVRGKNLGKPMGLNPYVAEKIGAAAAKFDESLLKEVYLGLADADYLIKTGEAGPEMLECAIISLSTSTAIKKVIK